MVPRIALESRRGCNRRNWLKIRPGNYSSEGPLIGNLSGLTMECKRKGNYEGLEMVSFSFETSKGVTPSPFVPIRAFGCSARVSDKRFYDEMCFLLDRSEYTAEAHGVFKRLAEEVPKLPRDFGINTVAICPSSDSWNVILNRKEQQPVEFRLVKRAGEEEAVEPARPRRVRSGVYTAPNASLNGLSSLTVDIGDVERWKKDSHTVHIIELSFVESVQGSKRVAASTNLRPVTNTLCDPFRRREMAVAGCLRPMPQATGSEAPTGPSFDEVFERLQAATKQNILRNTMCICPTDDENEVLLVLNKMDWGTDRMRSVKLFRKGDSVQPTAAHVVLPSEKHDASQPVATQVASLSKEHEPPTTQAKTMKRVMELSANSLSVGRAKVARLMLPLGKFRAENTGSLLSIDTNPSEWDVGITFSLGVIGRTFTFGARQRGVTAHSNDEGCFALDPQEPEMMSEFCRWLRAVLPEENNNFLLERGMHLCIDDEDSFTGVFGGFDQHDGNAVRLDFKRVN
ncbi:hypothetical protein FOZ63_026731 [Perkinsus olseni]|uniref:Uncharacterized protein n=1 Tax=Perkinsus olseni TaxID=32597 RepID=A0A7J6QB42_PEROL|nr:hypothetical protein FOZ63_026731 [Perkinsus olseni]